MAVKSTMVKLAVEQISSRKFVLVGFTAKTHERTVIYTGSKANCDQYLANVMVAIPHNKKQDWQIVMGGLLNLRQIRVLSVKKLDQHTSAVFAHEGLEADAPMHRIYQAADGRCKSYMQFAALTFGLPK